MKLKKNPQEIKNPILKKIIKKQKIKKGKKFLLYKKTQK